MTNVDLDGSPSDGELQRLTYSQYYGANCLKGGVCMTAFGYVVAYPLFNGTITDSLYTIVSGLLAEQEQLAKDDGGPPVTNMTDKGFRISAACAKAGGQRLITPVFMTKSKNGTFDALEGIHTTAVAHDRGQNERAVRRMKQLAFLKSGISLASDFRLVNMIWGNIGFRTNFLNGPFSREYLAEWIPNVNESLAKAGLPEIPSHE
jgi:DDE superfamily endonuclease